ncbi:pilus assembly PilX N-terminal domain-containing protein [Cerasicoccus frondis]|uniref:pilus assembly PilX N-terminal domain-containing protein n=1 Tax=Cerasicoccus frondis TaxID=490090 RepID=UPI0028525F4E|nr:PilX N-terminal domain-containing pilus assembly protein [Cerasicoccus frondis]
MKPHLSTSAHGGSALAVVLVLTTVLGIIVASLMTGTVSEMKLNDRHVVRLKAQNAAEASLEYGAADLASRFVRSSSFDTYVLKPENNPLSIPDSAKTFYEKNEVDGSSLSVQGGVIPPGEWKFIDPDDPSNELDEMRGKRIFVRGIQIYGMGSAMTAMGDKITSYAREVFEIRDAPLFSNAIFYNSDMRAQPGYDLDIYGPVHANGNMELGPNKGYTLTIYGKVTATGDITEIEGTGTTKLPKSSSQQTAMSGFDSLSNDWLSEAPQRWKGWVADGSLGVKPQNIVAFDDSVQDDQSTPGIERENNGYALIEPLLPNGHADRKNDDLRAQKMAYKAGLIIKVEHNLAQSDPNQQDYYKLSGYRYERSNSSDSLSAPKVDENNNPVLVAVDLPPDIIGDANSSMNAIDAPHPEFFNDGAVTHTVTETVQVLDHYETTYEEKWVKKKGKWKLKTVEVQTPVYRYEEQTTTYTTAGDGVSGGMYDHRENKEIDVVYLDVGKLAEYIDGKDNSSTGFDGTYDVDKHWNGVVYVEFPTSTTDSDGDGVFDYGSSTGKNSYNIVPQAMDDMALMLIDAKEIPEPSGQTDPGFTISTNAPLYTVGSFNADGSKQSDAPTKPDNSSELPAAIMADSITVLSDNWPNNRKHSDVDGRNNIQSKRPAVSHMEIAAAMVCGTPPDLKGPYYGDRDPNRPQSLGVINLPRFLEYWGSGRTLTIRGSLVSLFESEVRPEGAPNNFNDYYVPPNRNWGFNSLFAQGSYPPGTPLVRTYRRVSFEYINSSEYDDGLAGLYK